MKYYLEDIESGAITEVTKEQYDAYHNAIKQICSNFKGLGRVFVMGTTSDLNTNSPMYDLWNNPPENYKVIKWNFNDESDT